MIPGGFFATGELLMLKVVTFLSFFFFPLNVPNSLGSQGGKLQFMVKSSFRSWQETGVSHVELYSYQHRNKETYRNGKHGQWHGQDDLLNGESHSGDSQSKYIGEGKKRKGEWARNWVMFSGASSPCSRWHWCPSQQHCERRHGGRILEITIISDLLKLLRCFRGYCD